MMNRKPVSWSLEVSEVEGPCVVCGGNVHYFVGINTPTPAMLYHATCDPTPILRANLKTANPPLLPPEYTIHHKK